jgi:lichenan operon transcriptional antiterminator
LLDQRKTLILNTLLKKNRYLTSRDLSIIAGVTSRTVRNDLRILIHELRLCNMEVLSTPGSGYRIPEENKKLIHEWLRTRNERQPMTPEERLLFIIRFLLSGPVDVSRLLSRIHVSDSTWEKDIGKCSSWLKKSHLILKRRKNVLNVSGGEAHRRLAYIRYYEDASRVSGGDVVSLLSADFPNLEGVRKALTSFIKSMGFRLTDEDYNDLLICVLASIERGENHGLKTTDDVERRIRCFAAGLARHLSSNDILIGKGTALFVAVQFDGMFPKNGECAQLMRSLRKIVDPMLGEFFHASADDDLLESLGRISYPLVHDSQRDSENPISLQELERQYPNALELSIRYLNALRLEYSFETDAAALPKIGLCFAAYIERIVGIRRKKRICIICSTGIAGSQLLAAKIGRLYPHVEILGIFPKHRLEEAVERKPDLIISTIEIETDIDVVLVRNILDDAAFERIVPQLKKSNLGRMLFEGMISDRLFFPELEYETPEDVIRYLSDVLRTREGAGEDFAERVLKREALGTTAIGNLVAIPHAVPGRRSGNRICIGVLKKAIRWGKEKVQIVFLLKLDDPNPELAALFDYIYTLVSDRRFIGRVIEEREFSLLREKSDVRDAWTSPRQ